MRDSQKNFDISEHFVPNPGGRMPTEDEIATWADLARNGDMLVANPTRQAILYVLCDGEALPMPVFQSVTHLSEGGVAMHLRRLEEAGYISVEKYFDHRRRPRTSYRITHGGRAALENYRYKQRAANSVDLSKDP